MSGRVGKSNRAAFTLVELLVVIGIIALLISIIFPAITRIQASAKLVACKANLRSLLQANAIYGLDFKDAKPPLYQKRSFLINYAVVSVDMKWNGKPVGQGLLVDRKLVPLRTLLCPASEMVEDIQRDTTNWSNPTLTNSGGSYAYLYRWAEEDGATQTAFCQGITYNGCVRRGMKALLMDISADEGHPLEGAYSGRRWVNHRLLNRVNIAYMDGSVRDASASEIRQRFPFRPAAELRWFDDASKLMQ